VRGNLEVFTTAGVTKYWDGSAFQSGAIPASTYYLLTTLAPAGGLGVQAVTWTASNAPDQTTWLDGTYTLTVHSEDQATNFSADQVTNFVVDRTPPVVNV